MIEGKKYSRYGFFMAMIRMNALDFSKNITSLGCFFYDPKEDALRVKVKTAPLAKRVERLKYEFMNRNRELSYSGSSFGKN